MKHYGSIQSYFHRGVDTTTIGLNTGANTTMGEENTTPVSKNPTAVPFSLDRDGIIKRILDIRDKRNCTNNEQFSQLIYGDKSHSKTIDKWIGKNSLSIPSIDSLAQIAHSTGVSLDWLVFGKGKPPAQDEVEEEDEEHYNEDNEEDDEGDLEPGNTIRGFIGSLMHLSNWKYVRDFKIEAHSHDYFYHDINISFSIRPFPNRHLKYGITDTVACFVQGLRSLADPDFLDLPCTEAGIDEKLDHYAKILESMPLYQDLHNETALRRFSDLKDVVDPFYLEFGSGKSHKKILIPKSYDTPRR